MTATATADLFSYAERKAQAEASDPDAPLDLRFEGWIRTANGREVLALATERALALQARGWRHYGIKAILEAVRFDRDMTAGPDADGWKVNNNYASRLARRIMASRPGLAGFFETRALQGSGTADLG